MTVSFVKDIRKLATGLVLALFMTFMNESFVKRPAVLFREELTDLGLHGLLTLIAIKTRPNVTQRNFRDQRRSSVHDWRLPPTGR